MLLNTEDVSYRIEQIPPLSCTFQEVMQVLDQPIIEIADVERALAKDPVLAGRVVAVANSSFYGFPGKVSSLNQACLVLGFHTIRNMVIALGVMQSLRAEGEFNLDHTGLWQHSIGTAIASRILARCILEDEETAFTMGLLHDIGKIVLDIHFTGAYAEVMACRDSEDCLLYEAEESVLGFNHCLVGGLIARHWKLPGNIIQAIEQHHTPSVPLPSIVCLADILCRGLDIGDGGDSLIPLLDPALLSSLGIGMDTIRSCLPEIVDCHVHSNILLD